jgi:adenylate cyclase
MPDKSGRQLAAVIFTNVVGYTAMTQRNEEEALSAQMRQRDAVASSAGEHGGKVVQHDGDGSLTVFPSAIAAVSAAIDIQRVLAIDSPVPV